MRKTHQISEYGSFISSELEGYYTLEKKPLSSLKISFYQTKIKKQMP